MTVGQIQRNYIQQNSVGVGFFGYSGFSGWSGWSGWSGPAGGIAVSSGKFSWIHGVLVFDSLNGFYAYNNIGANYSAWQVFGIANFNNAVPPGTFWVDGDSTATGYTTKVRVRAVVNANYWGTSGDIYCLRVRKVNAASYEYPWDVSMASYADNNMLITDNRRYTFWGPVLTATQVSTVHSGLFSGSSGEYNIMPSDLTGPWVALQGDGFYMVEVFDLHTNPAGGISPDKIFLEFAKVKS